MPGIVIEPFEAVPPQEASPSSAVLDSLNILKRPTAWMSVYIVSLNLLLVYLLVRLWPWHRAFRFRNQHAGKRADPPVPITISNAAIEGHRRKLDVIRCSCDGRAMQGVTYVV